MNSLKHSYELISDIEGSTVKDIFRDSCAGAPSVAIKTADNTTYHIFHEKACCELVKIKLPENIRNLLNRMIIDTGLHIAEYEGTTDDYEFLANVTITDSLGEEYIIKFTGKSIGCGYTPDIAVQKEWIVCVFD